MSVRKPDFRWRSGRDPVLPVQRRDGRLLVLQVLLISLVVTLLGRLVWMQVGNGDEFRTLASSNSIREVIVPAQRGLILDQLGRPLVANRSSLTVTVDRAELARQKDDGKAVLTDLASELKTTPGALAQRLKSCGTEGAPAQPLCWNGPNEQPVVVADDVPRDVGLQLMEQTGDLPAVRVALTPTRSYPHPYGANVAHLAGYLGQVTQDEFSKLGDRGDHNVNMTVGRAGLEQSYQDSLAGHPGIARMAVSRSGKASEVLEDKPAQPGLNVVTNVDAHLQAVVEQQMLEAINRARRMGKKADSGSMVVVDTTNGHVLSMASYPAYDPVIWEGGISDRDYQSLTDPKQGTPLLNQTIQGLYAPASTFKVISTAAAFQSGYTGTTLSPCPSAYRVGSQTFNNYESHSYGSITLARALAVSCDTVFYRLAEQLWQRDGGLSPTGQSTESILRNARAFGLGRATGIDLPGEYQGALVGRAEKTARYRELKDAYCKRAVDGYPEVLPKSRAQLLKAYAQDYCGDGAQYRVGDALNFAIGQGDTAVTPLQIAMAYSAIANGGTLWRPEVARAIVAKDGTVQRTIDKHSNGQLGVPDYVLAYLRSALTQTTLIGTGAGAFAGFPLGRFPVAAKTGSAEVVGKDSTAWFASFAPANNPRYAVVCMVSQGGTGADACGPSVRRIYEAIYGVDGLKIDLSRSVLAGGEPSVGIPKVISDGFGEKLPGTAPTGTVSEPSPSVAASIAAPAGAPGETPAPTPQPEQPRSPSESGVGIVRNERSARASP